MVIATSLFEKNESSLNGLTVTSADGQPRRLNIIVPGQLGSGGAVSLSASTIIEAPITASIWAPGVVTVGGDSRINGTVSSGSLVGWGNTTIGIE